MKKRKINILLIIFVCLCVIAFAIFAFIYVQYNNAVKHIAEIETQHNALADFNQTYTNDAQKYHNSKIASNDTYAEYSNGYNYNGIYFGSNIEGIVERKLHGAALELLSNLHGDEIHYVASVVLEGGEEMYCKGSRHKETILYEIPVSLYNFLGDKSYVVEADISHLVIENVNADTKAADMAQALSVAYGYHFIDYYGIVDGTDSDINSKYYELRAQDNESIVLTLPDDETAEQNYRWYLKNIAAYDYMHMMGSSNANRFAISSSLLTKRYFFHYDSAEPVESYLNSKFQRGRNSYPHINMDLPMPDAVEGLYEYYYSFVDAQPPAFDNEIEPLGEMNFEVESVRRSLPRYGSHTYYDLYWDSITEDSGIAVTVVKYDMNDEMLSIESVGYGNVATASIDNLVCFHTGIIRHPRSYEYYFIPAKTLDEFKIRVIAYYPDGRVRVSEPYHFKY